MEAARMTASEFYKFDAVLAVYDRGYDAAVAFCRRFKAEGRLADALLASPEPASDEMDAEAWSQGWRDAIDSVSAQEAEHRHARNLGREG